MNLVLGKTKFVEGFLDYFNLKDEVSSPTFNIVNQYSTSNFDIFHFDVYRLSDEDEFYNIGGEEYFDKGICLIEWGELISNCLPLEYLQIVFKKSKNDENKRILTFKPYGKKYEEILLKLKEDLV